MQEKLHVPSRTQQRSHSQHGTAKNLEWPPRERALTDNFQNPGRWYFGSRFSMEPAHDFAISSVLACSTSIGNIIFRGNTSVGTVQSLNIFFV
jgi:hypothetical protein